MADAKTATPGPIRLFVRRWVRRICVLAVLLLIFAFFLPTIAVKLGAVQITASKASSLINGSIQIGGASVGWLSSIELTDVELKDHEGRTVLKAPRVLTSKSLLSLARSQGDLGTITVDNPQIELVCQGKLTNLEHVLEKILNDTSPAQPTRPQITVQVNDGDVTIIDKDRNQEWKLSGVQVTANVPAASSEPIDVQVQAKSGEGSLDAKVAAGSAIDLKLKATQFPMELSGHFIRRFEPGMHVSGRLNADLATTLGSSNGGPIDTIHAAGSVAATGLEVSSPRLGTETIKLASVQMPCNIDMVGGLVKVEKADLTCDLGTASFTGILSPTDTPEKLLDRTGITVSADLDLARVAAVMPKLVHLKEGTAVSEGKLQFRLASKTGTSGTYWEGSVATSAMKGTRDGKPLAWDQPLEAAFVGRLTADRMPSFEKLGVKSEFATITGTGNVDQFVVNGDVSLDKLSARLSEFVDLGATKMSGTAKLQVTNKSNGKGGSTLTGRIDLTQFVLNDGKRNFSEPQLSIDFAADGKYDASTGIMRIDSGKVTSLAGQDSLELVLDEAIPDVKTLQAGKAVAKITGDMLRWRTRLDGIVPIPKEYTLGGTGTVAGNVRFDARTISVSGLTSDLTNMRFYGAGLKLDEQIFKLYPTQLTMDRQTGVIDIPTLAAACQTIGLGAEKIRLAPNPDGSYAISMNCRAKANLLRMQRALQLQSSVTLADAVSGMVNDGSFSMEGSGNVYRFKANLPIKDFVFGNPQAPTWSEPDVTAQIEGEYDYAADSLKIVSSRVDRPNGFAADASGSINKITTITDLDLKGKVSYDLAQLEPQLKKYLGANVKAVGKDTRDFKLTGSLASATQVVTANVVDANGLPPSPTPAGSTPATPATVASGSTLSHFNGNAALAWQSLSAYGFDVGQAEAKAVLDKGVLRVDPLEATFGETGKVRIQPTVRLDSANYDMTLAPGKIVDHAKLTPKACADALGYALPAIAQSTSTEGTISLDVEDNTIPLVNPTAGTIKGKLTLHQVQVGPGPFLDQIAQALGANQTRVTLANEQVVPVRMEKGRVYHDNLQLTVAGYAIKTTGSVGMDGSLQMVCEMPIPQQYIGPLLNGTPKLRDAILAKRIQVPVGGTVAAPRLDRAAIGSLARQYVEEVGREAAKGKINEIIGDKIPGLKGVPGAPGAPGGMDPKNLIDQGKDKLKSEIEKGLNKFLPFQRPQQPPPPAPANPNGPGGE